MVQNGRVPHHRPTVYSQGVQHTLYRTLMNLDSAGTISVLAVNLSGIEIILAACWVLVNNGCKSHVKKVKAFDRVYSIEIAVHGCRNALFAITTSKLTNPREFLSRAWRARLGTEFDRRRRGRSILIRPSIRRPGLRLTYYISYYQALV